MGNPFRFAVVLDALRNQLTAGAAEITKEQTKDENLAVNDSAAFPQPHQRLLLPRNHSQPFTQESLACNVRVMSFLKLFERSPAHNAKNQRGITMFKLPQRLASLLLVLAATVAAGQPGFAGDHDHDRHDPVTTAAANVKHVFVIVLENKTFSNTFGTSTQDPYLQKTLVPKGALLTQYYGTGHVSLDNYISMISGQSPTPDTDDDCLPGLSGSIGNYTNVEQTGTTPDGQVIATGGCIYPKDVQTLPGQLEEAGLTWKGYMGDMGNDPARESATCGHPEIGVGTDNTNGAEAPSAAVPLGDPMQPGTTLSCTSTRLSILQPARSTW